LKKGLAFFFKGNLASRKGKELGREAYAGEGNQGFRKRV
jgi:hypothetical protein